MSRFEIHHNDKAIAFGEDRTGCGLFLQIWNRPAINITQDFFNPDELIVDTDMLTDKTFDPEKLLKLAEEHGFRASELHQLADILKRMESAT